MGVNQSVPFWGVGAGAGMGGGTMDLVVDSSGKGLSHFVNYLLKKESERLDRLVSKYLKFEEKGS